MKRTVDLNNVEYSSKNETIYAHYKPERKKDMIKPVVSENGEQYAASCYFSYENAVTKDENPEPAEKPTSWKVLTIPLGYGKMAIDLGTVSCSENQGEDTSPKEGDLVIRFNALKEPVVSKNPLTEEQKEYANQHPLVQLVATKEYALHLSKLLELYATKGMDEVVKWLRGD